MTIIIGAIHDGEVFIGADSLWSWSNNFVREMKTDKFLAIENTDVMIAGSGEERLSQVFTEMLNEKSNRYLLEIETKEDVIALAKELHSEVGESGVGPPKDNEMPDHNMGFLLARKGYSKLWLLDSDYTVTEFDDYVCIGAGGELGECAMKALSKCDIHGKQAVLKAIESVNDCHPYCGGRIDLRTLEGSSDEEDEEGEEEEEDSEKPKPKPKKKRKKKK